ncbi:hypothetical protein MT325_m533R [Paramecium bursaria chlorella virus MT325]|uniref:Uncharacterized protein m533R n=1 Tax=Paramecium bursaria Chlorella virus MT325 TaxID=346932 RepID=A7IUR3_PBCVM|nr:hypothetical protein MT325_m533R [Paramecium bursaria chlorella virus MT325]
MISPGKLNFGCFPHAHLLLITLIIFDVLHSTQCIPLSSPGRLKLGIFPHGHFLIMTLIISDSLCALHHFALRPSVLYDACFLHLG